MATRIINKLYDFKFDLIETKTVTYKGDFHNIIEIDTTYEPCEPPVKRANKNLESLIKHINSNGYTVSLSQIFDAHDHIVWSCFVHNQRLAPDTVVGHTTAHHKTAYQALKKAWANSQRTGD